MNRRKRGDSAIGYAGIMKSTAHRLAQIADELRAHANLGLYYVQDAYDLDRYRRILELSAELASLPSNKGVTLDLDEIQSAYLKGMAHISPLLGVEALVRRDGNILLMRRSDNGLWALPSGLVEVGESLAGAAVRELLEETGLLGQAIELLAMSDTHFDQGSALHIVTATFLIEASGEPHPTLEATEVGWFVPGQWPPLNAGQSVRLAQALQALEARSVYFDPAGEFLPTPQERSTAGESPKDTEEVQAARQLLRTVVLGQLERKA